ncbi:hypothetical protein RSOLAG1IB_11145 [Rhizoctonia solani AG-1 IB]|uniref:Uncharacterized protein n=1 Tax=Thanatephorus cucumeris (strain AG1-IB / isolate 7/3/14) TaxID=1108050 RepID=A0A0B7F5I3_THACB|nr:hypothetical protein RSOLAG1IB_11145 [Rhizoctonia solani AG-1 IB]
MSETIPAPLGPVSKRKQKHINNRRVNTAAAEADAILRAHIKNAATELGVSMDEVFQRFALISPVGEQRTPMWWNGLVIEKSAEWKDEYDGPGRKQLSWVTHRIRQEGLTSQLTKEEKARYAELAAETRSKNKDAKTASLTRKQAIESAEEQLTQVHSQLETLHARLGVEYLLVTTRGALEDKMAPMYVCSEKADTFLQGHMNIPMKGLLTHLDFYVIGMEAAGTKKILGKKQELRVSVRTRLKTSLSTLLVYF